MTKDQKRRLANALIAQAIELLESMHDVAGHHADIADIDRTQAAGQFAMWLQDLPGDGWDNRLPPPQNKKNKELTYKTYARHKVKEEAKFRAWARENYSPFATIPGLWPPIVREECMKINQEFLGNGMRLMPPEANENGEGIATTFKYKGRTVRFDRSSGRIAVIINENKRYPALWSSLENALNHAKQIIDAEKRK